MNVLSLIAKVNEAGGLIDVKDGNLKLKAPHALPTDLIDELKRQKAEIIAAVEADQDVREYFEERAAIMEYDGGLSRKEAEETARKAIRVYRYRITDTPDTWLVMIAPHCELEDAQRSLALTFGNRLIEVEHLR